MKWFLGFIPKWYAKIEIDGSFTIDYIENILCYIDDYPDDAKVSIVLMSRRKFEALPEFNGF